jgi:polysaccharide pyruvyl transferase WcaK-like protein
MNLRDIGSHGNTQAPARSLLLVGYFGRGNLGDDAMRDGLAKFLAREIPTVKTRWQPLPAWRLASLPEVLALLRNLYWSDAVVLAGGTHFHDGYGRRSLRILATHWIVFSVARLLGANVGYAGVGIGPLTTAAGRWLTRRIATAASVILLRDDPSMAEITQLNSRAQLIRGFDSASLLSAPRAAHRKTDRHVGISLIPYFTVFDGDPQKDRIAVLSCADALADIGTQNSLTTDIFAFNTQGLISDLPISKELAKSLEGRLPVSLQVCDNPDSTLRRLANLTGLIATRYHAALLGYLVGLPMIVVSYEDKCSALAQEIGLPAHAVIKPDDLLQPNRVKQCFERLAHDPDSCRATVAVRDSVGKTLTGLHSFFSALLPTVEVQEP